LSASIESCQIPPGKSDPGRINTQWNDEDVLPPVLSPDTEFVFDRMTAETLKAARAGKEARVLDVGCGRAIDAASLTGNGSHLFGCDPSRVMLQKARGWLQHKKAPVVLVGSIAENLPFVNGAFQGVVCKGAIDHFMDPQRAVAEMCRVASPAGKVVLSLANFESLSCRLGRWLDRLHRKISGRGIRGPHIWDIPKDHTYKFDYPATLALAQRNLDGISVRGVSLLWGFPRWSNLLKRFPHPVALTILNLLNRIAVWHPPWGDVLIVTGRPLKNSERKE
jgi:SAM-dependent methyltransferase